MYMYFKGTHKTVVNMYINKAKAICADLQFFFLFDRFSCIKVKLDHLGDISVW